MYAPDADNPGVNPFQRVVHGADRHASRATALASQPELAEALAVQLGRAIVASGANVNVRIRRLRITIADPASLRAAGLHLRLLAEEQWSENDRGNGRV